MAIEIEYEAELQKAEQEERAKPERIILAKNENELHREVGLFLANTYGLPKTEEWLDKYITILPKDKKEELQVITTKLIGKDWQDMKAIRISAMHEAEVLEYIELAIRTGFLNPVTNDSNRAVFKEDMDTEDYLRKNADVLSSHIDKHMKPLYDGSYFLPSVGGTKRVSLPAQARATMGALEVLKEDSTVFLSADLGTG